MKNVIIASALMSFVGTAGFACTVEESNALSESISNIVQDLVALDDANLGKVMSIMNVAAVTEYHAEQAVTTCVRQRLSMDMLAEFAESLETEQSAMLNAEKI